MKREVGKYGEGAGQDETSSPGAAKVLDFRQYNKLKQ